MNWIGASIYDIAKIEINQNFVPRKIKKGKSALAALEVRMQLIQTNSTIRCFRLLAVKCVRRYLPSVRTLLRFRRPPPVTGQHCISAIRRVAFVVRQPGTRVIRPPGCESEGRTGGPRVHAPVFSGS